MNNMQECIFPYSQYSIETIVHTYITLSLDYCNALLYGRSPKASDW